MNSMLHGSILKVYSCAASQKIPVVMELEYSLPPSQKPATGPEPDLPELSPHPQDAFL